jgi:hypothetical protein
MTGIMHGASQFKLPRSPQLIGEIFNVSYVTAANTYTGLSYRDSPVTPGKVQIYHATNQHGLTQGVSAGFNEYVAWSLAPSLSGLHKILSIDSVTEMTIDLAYAAGYGTPTVSLGNTGATLPQTITVPGGSMGLTGRITIDAWANIIASTNTKTVQTLFGASSSNLVNTASGTAPAVRSIQDIVNLLAYDKQRSTGIAAVGATSAGSLLSENTLVDKVLSFRITPAVHNEPISLDYILVHLS